MGLVATMTGQPVDALLATMSGQASPVDLGSGILLIGLPFFVALISFFSATSTMARSAEDMSAFAVKATAWRAAALRGH